MSKIDAQRAMREAKYARIKASGPSRREVAAKAAAAAGDDPPVPADPTSGTPATESPAAKPARARKTARAPKAAALGSATAESGAPDPDSPEDAAAAVALCGHKSMNGRACTREAGHSEKSHRYG